MRPAKRRDLMRVGKRVSIEHVDAQPRSDEYSRCPHCYREECTGCVRKRNAKYSIADYAPYLMTEDDLIACIDLLRTL